MIFENPKIIETNITEKEFFRPKTFFHENPKFKLHPHQLFSSKKKSEKSFQVRFISNYPVRRNKRPRSFPGIAELSD